MGRRTADADAARLVHLGQFLIEPQTVHHRLLILKDSSPTRKPNSAPRMIPTKKFMAFPIAVSSPRLLSQSAEAGQRQETFCPATRGRV